MFEMPSCDNIRECIVSEATVQGLAEVELIYDEPKRRQQAG
jgi:ATP-dependent protease Clp ATPase subunit